MITLSAIRRLIGKLLPKRGGNGTVVVVNSFGPDNLAEFLNSAEGRRIVNDVMRRSRK